MPDSPAERDQRLSGISPGPERLLSGLGHAYGWLNRFGRHRPAGEFENEFPVGDLVPLESEFDGVCELTRVELGVPSRTALRR